MDDLVEDTFCAGVRDTGIMLEFDIQSYCNRITFAEAAALRDWLIKVIPASAAKTAAKARPSFSGWIQAPCQNCGKLSTEHTGIEMLCPRETKGEQGG